MESGCLYKTFEDLLVWGPFPDVKGNNTKLNAIIKCFKIPMMRKKREMQLKRTPLILKATATTFLHDSFLLF